MMTENDKIIKLTCFKNWIKRYALLNLTNYGSLHDKMNAINELIKLNFNTYKLENKEVYYDLKAECYELFFDAIEEATRQLDV